MGKIYIFDIGTRLRTTLDVDLAGYDTVEYSIEKPDETSITRECQVEDEGNGIVYYDTILNDLDQHGTYHIQVQVVFVGGTSQFESETQDFIVYDPFK